jgi:hypothetical protein
MSIEQRFVDVLYNVDRAIASAAGAPAQETISSEAGRLEHTELWAALLCRVLNFIEPGHCQHAIVHADSLESADRGSS